MSENGRRRAVVTGLGAVSPLGNDVETTWANVLAGKSGAGPITHFDPSEYPVHFACEVKDFDPEQWIDRKTARRMDRFTHLVLAAARQAEADSGIDIASEAPRIGASVATGIGGLQSFQDCYDVLRDRGPDRVGPFSIPAIIPNLGAGWLSIELGTQGPLSAQCTACAASNMSIGESLDAIRLGRADAMLCGGTEAPIAEVGMAGFLGDARAVAAERRPRAREPAVRCRARRLRHGRGGRGDRPRGARACPRARREDLRRDHRLRRLLRRKPHHGARSPRPRHGR